MRGMWRPRTCSCCWRRSTPPAGTGTLINLISVGATVVMTPGTEPGAVLEAIEAEGVTNTSQTPTFYLRMIRHPDFSVRDLSSLRQAHVYGGPIPFGVVSGLRAPRPGDDVGHLLGTVRTQPTGCDRLLPGRLRGSRRGSALDRQTRSPCGGSGGGSGRRGLRGR